MKASELRIGNLVTIGDGAFPVVVADLRAMSESESHIYKPIEITQLILFAFGFDYIKSGASGCDQWSGMGFWSKDGINRITLRGDKNCRDLRIEGYFNSSIRFVHELQNLHFALTGKELTRNNQTLQP